MAHQFTNYFYFLSSLIPKIKAEAFSYSDCINQIKYLLENKTTSLGRWNFGIAYTLLNLRSQHGRKKVKQRSCSIQLVDLIKVIIISKRFSKK